MLSTTTSRDLQAHFPLGTDLPDTNHRDAPQPFQLLTPSSLQVISAAGARGMGAQGGASGRRIPRDGDCGGNEATGRTRDGEGVTRDATGWQRRRRLRRKRRRYGRAGNRAERKTCR